MRTYAEGGKLKAFSFDNEYFLIVIIAADCITETQALGLKH